MSVSGRLTLRCDRMGWAWAPTFMTYGPRWKAHRRIFQTRIGTSSLSSHLHLVQQYANVKLLNGLLRKPEEFMKHTHWCEQSQLYDRACL